MVKETVYRLVDDIDGGEATTTLAFTYEGVSYEIDVNDHNAASYHDLMHLYVKHARKVEPPKRRRGRPSKVEPAATPGTPGEWVVSPLSTSTEGAP
jgi:hypothetical protein